MFYEHNIYKIKISPYSSPHSNDNERSLKGLILIKIIVRTIDMVEITVYSSPYNVIVNFMNMVLLDQCLHDLVSNYKIYIL